MFPGKTILKKIYFAAHAAIGTDNRQLEYIKKNKIIPILSFHRVSEQENSFWPPLKPHLFDQLLGYFTKHFEIIGFGDLQKETKLPKALLSFDDGYLDFYEVAVPILRKYGVRSNMNIIPGIVLNGANTWNAELYDFLQFAPDRYVEKIKLDAFPFTLNRSSNAQKIQYGLRISRYLKNQSRVEREPLWKPIAELIQAWKAEVVRPRQFMNLEEIRSILSEHDIGAHSFSHESMGYESNDYFQQDFQRCQVFFQETLKQKLDLYAFPNGSYRSEQVSYLLEQKVGTVLLVDEALSRADTNVHKRITVSANSFENLKLQALGYLTR